MTIPATSRVSPIYQGNASATVFAFSYKTYDKRELQVIVSDGVTPQTLTLDSDYGVFLNADQVTTPGGLITYPLIGSPLAAGLSLVVVSAVPNSQDVSLPTGGAFNAGSVELGFDRLEVQLQQFNDTLNRTIRVPVGEVVSTPLPAALVRAGYLLGFDGAGNPVAVAPTNGSAAALAIDLASTASTTKGAGQIGFSTSVAYVANTVGAYLRTIALGGASAINFLQSGTGAVVRTLQAVLRGRVRIRDFGAVCDGATDDTAAIQAAIVFASQQFPSNSWFDPVYALLTKVAPRTVDFEGATCKITGKLLLPSGVSLRGDQATLIGTGNTSSDNTCIETAYWNGATLTSNVATSPETQVIQAARIQGFRFINFKLALNLYDFTAGCKVEDVELGNCYQGMVANRCFYARFINISVRENVTLAASTLPALDFQNFVNAEHLESISVVGRILGIQFTGAFNGTGLRTITVENGTNGIKWTGEVNPCEVGAGCYFESLTGIALDFTTASAHRAVTIDNVWFNNCGTAIAGVQMISGRIGKGNYYLNCTNKVVINDTLSLIDVEVPASLVSDAASTLPTVPAGFSIGSGCRVVYPLTVVSNVNGTAQTRSTAMVDQYADLPYFGQVGHVSGQVAFCTTSHTGTTTATVNIDTKITFDVYVMGIFYVKIVDSGGNTFINGRFYGTTVVLDTAAGKTVTVSNNGGYVRLSLSTFNTPVDAQCEGIVRIV